MTDARPTHDAHDPLTIARLAGNDLSDAELESATALVADCPHCRVLRDDLLALASANRDLPAPSRPRDFRIRDEDAARLRRRGWWHRIAGALAGPRFELARPVGAAMASLGLAGLLLSSFSSIQLGQATGAAPAGRAEPSQALQMYSAATDEQGGVTEVNPDTGVFGAGGSPPRPADRDTAQVERGADGSTPDTGAEVARQATDATLIVLSGTFLIVGLGLFGLRWTARRLGDG